MHLLDRAAMNVDPAAVQRAKQARAAREKAERIAHLRRSVFRQIGRGGNSQIDALRNEADALQLLKHAKRSADGFLALKILQVAIDKRWGQVVKAGIYYFYGFPTLQELWDLTLTTGRSAV